MVHKSLPVYYLTILWLVAVVTVFFIVKPLVSSTTGKDDFGNISEFTIAGGGDKYPGQEKNTTIISANPDENNSNLNNTSDLIFYDKTAFIRYFRDKYSEEELTESYDKALQEKTSIPGKAPIRVTRINENLKSKKSFSGSFDIRPVPVHTNN